MKTNFLTNKLSNMKRKLSKIKLNFMKSKKVVAPKELTDADKNYLNFLTEIYNRANGNHYVFSSEVMLYKRNGKRRINLTEHFHINRVISDRVLYELGYLTTKDGTFKTGRDTVNLVKWFGDAPTYETVEAVKEWARKYDKDCKVNKNNNNPKRKKRGVKVDATDLKLNFQESESTQEVKSIIDTTENNIAEIISAIEDSPIENKTELELPYNYYQLEPYQKDMYNIGLGLKVDVDNCSREITDMLEKVEEKKSHLKTLQNQYTLHLRFLSELANKKVLELLESLIGKETSIAKQLVENAGYKYRIVKQGNNIRLITADFNPFRINVVINENKIVINSDMG